MTPQLTPEQKEHLKIAHRAHVRIEETWQLFTMFLSDGKTPEDALERAHSAVAVWADWMDSAQVEPPDIERPDFGQQIVDSMGKMFEKLPKGFVPSFAVPIPQSLDVAQQVGQVAAEFTAEPLAAALPSTSSPADSSTEV